MKKVFVVIGIVLGLTTVAFGQSETDLRKSLEGRQVRARIDLPKTKDGVNIYPEREQSFAYEEYGQRVKSGVSIHREQMVELTRVKVKDRHIEVQLSSVSTSGTEAATSRFNIHFRRIDPMILSPHVMVAALRRYVEFSSADLAELTKSDQPHVESDFLNSKVVRVGQSTTYLKDGLSASEVVSLLGTPIAVYRRDENGVAITTYAFKRGADKVVIAEFVGGTLVRSRTESRVSEARSGGY